MNPHWNLGAGENAAAQTALDAQLLERLSRGESAALGEIYDRHAPALYRLLMALLNHPSDAEDALQSVFVKLALKRPRRVQQVRAYLLGMARHEALSILRRRPRESQIENNELLEIPSTETEETAFLVSVDWSQMLTRLPVEQREVIALKVWDELTFVEIARVVGVSPNTAMSRYRYGIARLRLWCKEAVHE